MSGPQLGSLFSGDRQRTATAHVWASLHMQHRRQCLFQKVLSGTLSSCLSGAKLEGAAPSLAQASGECTLDR